MDTNIRDLVLASRKGLNNRYYRSVGKNYWQSKRCSAELLREQSRRLKETIAERERHGSGTCPSQVEPY
ncbi:MAG: hypothetical protein IJP59_00245 [Muribaculaceae bacterium]|nr:hypothetical protein [Muribaculaceae bacterium]